MTRSERDSLRIALVLNGGGAKGAYQIGCWKALRAAGMTRYAAIAGTSVGALNAALIATDRVDASCKFWRTIRRRDVVGLRLAYVPTFPLWLSAALYRRWFVPIRASIPGSRAVERTGALWALVFWLYGLPAMSNIRPTPVEEIWFQLLGLGGVLVALLYISPLAKWSLLNLPLTSNAPLTQLVTAEFKPDSFSPPQMPVFATLSRYRPERLAAQPRQGWLPQYVRLDHLPRADFVDVLLTSAGLPGIFPPRQVLGDEAIDGGWCDNVPLAPIWYSRAADIDLVLVIHLDHAAATVRWRTSASGWSREQTGAHVAEEDAAHHWENQSPPKGPDADRLRPPRTLHLFPSRDLGGFIKGTLGFSPAKATRLMCMGEKDMQRLLQALLDDNGAAYEAAAVPRGKHIKG